MKYDIFAKLQEEINDFDTSGYYLTGAPKSKTGTDSNQKGKKGGYYYSQRETLESIDMACASKYKKGVYDEEGQRKTYINVVNFYRDVMLMKIVIRVANYLFEPLSMDYTYPVFLMGRKFGIFSEIKSYDDEIQDRARDLATYGSCVSRRCEDSSERVPLRTIRNTQSAKSLWHAAENGGYVIIEDDKHFNELTEYPDWETDGLKTYETYNTFETYRLVPESVYKNWRTNNGKIDNVPEKDKWVLVQAILIPTVKSGNDITDGKLVWMEKVDEESWPLDECHTERIDGRWLGKGEPEKQLENQIARNLNANLRRRGLLWATKKIFYRAGTNADDVPEQLLMEVRDGQMLFLGQNGMAGQINTGSQHNAEFNADDQAWKENSQQNSFAFNIATGENMPSGTSFSLGVVLEKAVSSHFTLTRNRFSNYLKRDFFNQILDVFREEHADAHTQQIAMGATDIENLKESMITYHANERYFKKLAKRERRIDYNAIREEVAAEMMQNPYLFINVPEEFYPDAHYFMRLNIDDDISADVNTLTTIWQTLKQEGDPRAEQVLAQIMAKQGRNLAYIQGKKPEPKPLPAPVAPGAPATPNAQGGMIPSPMSPNAPAAMPQ